jgi:putative oxidoreductase
MNTKIYYLERFFALVAALILLQTLFYKFSAHEDSVYIFSTLGVEPYGRIGLGIVELIAAILLLYPKTTLYGSVLGIGIMTGAIITHLFILGVVVNNDGGTLFLLALIVLLCCTILFFIRRKQFYALLKKVIGRC